MQDLDTEVKGLYFVNRAHESALKELMLRSGITDTVSPWFVPLYVISALPKEIHAIVSSSGIVEELLQPLYKTYSADVLALLDLSRALSPSKHSIDLHNTFNTLAESLWFELALHAISLRWESPGI
jgi:hypothetical protein